MSHVIVAPSDDGLNLSHPQKPVTATTHRHFAKQSSGRGAEERLSMRGNTGGGGGGGGGGKRLINDLKSEVELIDTCRLLEQRLIDS